MNAISRDVATLLMPRILRRTTIQKSGCWTSDISVNAATGYSKICFRINKRNVYYYAHRVSYVLHRGLIPDGMTIDHLCLVRNCINPDHLEVVTQSVNILRSWNPAAVNARKTQCLRGHHLLEFQPGKQRACGECRRMRYRISRQVAA